jgi:peptidoglycan/LPS O-acetylase OafA/YrhL
LIVNQRVIAKRNGALDYRFVRNAFNCGKRFIDGLSGCLLHSARRRTRLPGLAAIVCGLYIGENNLTIATCIWQFPLIAFGMAALLVCGISPRLPFRRIEVPGAAFFASIAYSVYLSHKLVIHAAIQFCSNHNIALTSVPAILLVELLIYAAGLILFLSIERPFLQLRHRLTRSLFPRSGL